MNQELGICDLEAIVDRELKREAKVRLLNVALVAIAAVHCLRAADRPNILFIFTDDQSYRSVSSYKAGQPWIDTPNIDQLAKEGIRFTDAYAGTWCSPSRAMILTGLYPHSIQGLHIDKEILATYDPEKFRMWPEVFRKNGYTTVAIGKWHLSKDVAHGRAWDHSVFWNHSVPDEAGPYHFNQKVRIDGGPYTAIAGYSTDNYTRYAEEFIRGEHSKPWFLWLCFDSPHTPFESAPRHRHAYPNAPVELPADVFPPRPGKPKWSREYQTLANGKDGVPITNQNRPLPEVVRDYERAGISLDEGVARMMQVLRETNQLKNTIVVFTSDQGLAMGHKGSTNKLAPYDDNIKTPLIVRLPDGTSAGRLCRRPVIELDLIPTFFAYAGIPLPWEMPGRDLRPLFANPEMAWPYPVFLEHFQLAFGDETDRGVAREEDYRDYGGVPWWLFLRDGKYKYIRTLVEDEIEELYDLEADPHELVNLAGRPEMQKKLRELQGKLMKELDRTHAKFKPNLPKSRKALAPDAR